jgi:hypothetical protein
MLSGFDSDSIPISIPIPILSWIPCGNPWWLEFSKRAPRGRLGVQSQRLDVGFGRIVASATEAPNMLANPVWSGGAPVHSGDAAAPDLDDAAAGGGPARIYEGALLFVTGIYCNYRDSPYKRE